MAQRSTYGLAPVIFKIYWPVTSLPVMLFLLDQICQTHVPSES